MSSSPKCWPSKAEKWVHEFLPSGLARQRWKARHRQMPPAESWPPAPHLAGVSPCGPTPETRAATLPGPDGRGKAGGGARVNGSRTSDAFPASLSPQPAFPLSGPLQGVYGARNAPGRRDGKRVAAPASCSAARPVSQRRRRFRGWTIAATWSNSSTGNRNVFSRSPSWCRTTPGRAARAAAVFGRPSTSTASRSAPCG